MDLLKTLMDAAGSGQLEKLGSQFGLDASAVEKVMEQVVPALGSGIKKNAISGNGLDSLVGALQNGKHQDYLGNVEAAASTGGVSEGNSILGHILGSKDASRNVASQAASASGVSSDLIKKLLPVIASMAMGALSKQTSGGAQLKSAGSSGGAMDMLGSLLGSGSDGIDMDDVMDVAKKFF